MVEVARSAMLDPEAGILEGTSGTEELTCADDIRADNPANKRNAARTVENNFIPCLRLRRHPIETDS